MENDGHNQNLKARTRKFALQIIGLYGRLPKSTPAQVIGKQLIRCGTSVGAHYHEAARGRSAAEYISKIETALQELEETDYWLALLGESRIWPPERLTDLQQEVGELSAILFACARKAKKAPRTRNPY